MERGHLYANWRNTGELPTPHIDTLGEKKAAHQREISSLAAQLEKAQRATKDNARRLEEAAAAGDVKSVQKISKEKLPSEAEITALRNALENQKSRRVFSSEEVHQAWDQTEKSFEPQLSQLLVELKAAKEAYLALWLEVERIHQQKKEMCRSLASIAGNDMPVLPLIGIKSEYLFDNWTYESYMQEKVEGVKK